MRVPLCEGSFAITVGSSALDGARTRNETPDESRSCAYCPVETSRSIVVQAARVVRLLPDGSRSIAWLIRWDELPDRRSTVRRPGIATSASAVDPGGGHGLSRGGLRSIAARRAIYRPSSLDGSRPTTVDRRGHHVMDRRPRADRSQLAIPSSPIVGAVGLVRPSVDGGDLLSPRGSRVLVSGRSRHLGLLPLRRRVGRSVIARGGAGRTLVGRATRFRPRS
jgi:hypothetical protein